MENCEFYKNLLEKLIVGEIDNRDEGLLKTHLKDCKDCATYFNAHDLLDKSNSPFQEASENDLQRMRGDVIDSIRKQQENSIYNKIIKLKEYIQIFLKRPELVFAAVALILGFFLGRALPPDENGITGGIVRQINSIAQNNINFIDTKNSAYQFSNVAMEEMDDKKISLSFDVSTHLDVVRKKNDPLVKEILAQTLVNPEQVGTRLKAISYSESILDDKIKEALIFSMKSAPLLAVRLKAMSSLIKYENDSEIQDAFVNILLEEKSIKMNLMAIDYLTESNFDPDTLRSLISEIDPSKSTAVFIRAKKYIEEN